jgi:hypothetical protein
MPAFSLLQTGSCTRVTFWVFSVIDSLPTNFNLNVYQRVYTNPAASLGWQLITLLVKVIYLNAVYRGIAETPLYIK